MNRQVLNEEVNAALTKLSCQKNVYEKIVKEMSHLGYFSGTILSLFLNNRKVEDLSDKEFNDLLRSIYRVTGLKFEK